MEPEKIAERLQRLGELEQALAGKKPVFGDPEVIEYHRLVEGIQILSLEELRGFQQYLLGEERQRERKAEEYKERRETRLLESLGGVCTPEAYTIIESIIRRS